MAGALFDEITEQSRHRSYAVARKYVRKADVWKRNLTQRIVAPAAAGRPPAAAGDPHEQPGGDEGERTDCRRRRDD